MDSLAQRRFDLSRQTAFVALSGDANPIHVDPVASRRLFFGGIVVHGVHQLLWALDVLSKSRAVESFHAQFVNPVLVDQTLDMRAENAGGSYVVEDGGQTATRIQVVTKPRLSAEPIFRPFGSIENVAGPKFADARTFDEMAHDEGAIPLCLDTALARELFPDLLRNNGPAWLAACLAATRLVGMVCPGRDSIFGELKMGPISTLASEPMSALRYRVAHSSRHLRMLRLQLNGPDLAGTALAFVRPPPVAQLSAAEACRRIAPGSFGGTRALVLGGSRGLGEVAAKLLAAGGAQVTLTYRQGRDDAVSIADEIIRAGGAASAVACDAGKPDSLPSGIFDHLYYFATPHIGKNRGTPMLEAVLSDDFRSAAIALRSRNAGRFAAFYPSTAFLDMMPPGFEHYCAAKSKAETYCREIADIPNTVVCAPRLPRLQTDQTSSIVPQSVDAPAPLLHAWLDAMHKNEPGRHVTLQLSPT